MTRSATITSHKDVQAFRRPCASTVLKQVRDVVSRGVDGLVAQSETLDDAAHAMIRCLLDGGKILTAGNGGSAAEAQHFAAELVGRFKLERSPWPAVCLNTDSSVITAIANDYGYERIFSRQIEGIATPPDVLVLFSTSGESPNCIEAARVANRKGVTVVTITGPRPNGLAALASYSLVAPGQESCRVQELHIILTHLLCEIVESALSESEASSPYWRQLEGVVTQ